MPNSQDIGNLISGLQRTDPRLYEILSRLSDRVSSIEADLTESLRESSIKTVGEVDIEPPKDVVVEFTGRTIHITWNPGDSHSRQYELRLGVSWDTATYITTTPARDVQLNPIKGDLLSFLLKAVDIDGNISAKTTLIIVQPVIPQASGVSIEVIDNNVLLRWGVPNSSFDINYYEVYKGDDKIGNREGTFATFFENVSGDYTYGVVAIDVAGNVGPISQITSFVNQPPDYILEDSYISDFSGTKFNCDAIVDISIGG